MPRDPALPAKEGPTSSVPSQAGASPSPAPGSAAGPGQPPPSEHGNAGQPPPSEHGHAGQPPSSEHGHAGQSVAGRAQTEAADLGAAVAAVRLEHGQEAQVLDSSLVEWHTQTQRAGQPPWLDLVGGGTWGGYAQRLGRFTPGSQGRPGLGNPASGDTLAPSAVVGGASTQAAMPAPPQQAQHSIVYELRIYSVEGPL